MQRDPANVARPPRRFRTLLSGVVLVGGLGWLIDAGLLWLLHVRLGVTTELAAAIGFATSGIANYLLNRALFQADGNPHGAQIVRFVSLFAVNLVIVTIFVPLLARAFDPTIADDGLRVLAAKVIVTVVMLVPNTLAYRHWVFAVSRQGSSGGTAAA